MVIVRLAHPVYHFDVPVFTRVVPKELRDCIIAAVNGRRLPGAPHEDDCGFGRHWYCDIQWTKGSQD